MGVLAGIAALGAAWVAIAQLNPYPAPQAVHDGLQLASQNRLNDIAITLGGLRQQLALCQATPGQDCRSLITTITALEAEAAKLRR